MKPALYVDADVVLDLIEAIDDDPGVKRNFTEKQGNAFETLAEAKLLTVQPACEAVPISKLNGAPVGDETMPTEARLIARLEAACRLIDSFGVYSIFSVKFVAEQKRFIQELRGK